MQEQNQTPQYDPQAVAMVRALKMQESGNDYNAPKEKAGTSLGGAYQYQAPTWKAYAGDVLGDPNAEFTSVNQDKVTYGMVKKWKDSGMQPSEIAHMWNPGDKAYPDQVVSKLKDIANNTQNNYNPKPYSNPTKDSGAGVIDYSGSSPNPTAGATNTQPENLWQKAGDVAKGVGNFLFPIAGDVYHDFKGDSQKTFLQQTGDTALSALPFIPGLGEAGLLAKGGKVAVEGGGLLSKLAASTIAKGAGVGYGAGVASNLSQGQGFGQAFVPNANNIGGAVLGGAAPIALKGLGSLAEGISGMSPQIKNALQNSGISEAEYNQYLNAAKSHATDLRAPTPLNLAADQLDTAAQKVVDARKSAGQAVETAKRTVGNQTLGDITPVIENFNNQLESKYGLSAVTGKDGSMTLLKIPGRAVDISPSDISRLKDVAKKLNNLKDAPLSVASDQASNISNLVDYSKKDLLGTSNDPLESLLKTTDGGIRQVINETSPQMAQANANYSGLKNLESEIATMADKNANRGELLMRRVFSGDKSGDVQDLFEKIKAVTGIDLINHSILAKHAIDTVGDKTQRSLMSQAIEGGISAHTGGLFNGAYNVGKNIIKSTVANPEKMGRNLVKGNNPGLLRGLITKGAIEAGARSPNLLK